MISRILIEETGSGRLEAESKDLFEEFSSRGYAVELFTEKQIRRRQLLVDRRCLVHGSIQVVISALKQMKISIPVPDDYPECLLPFLRRRVWETSLDIVREKVYGGDFKPLFVKPKRRLKHFTGKVIASYDDLSELSGISRQTRLVCSEVVSWLSEYRVFVIGGRTRGIRHYSGDHHVALNESVVASAVDTLQNSGDAHAGYAIDLGVLDDGATALIELNDGFALGSYGLERSIYADLVLARRTELVSG